MKGMVTEFPDLKGQWLVMATSSAGWLHVNPGYFLLI